MCISTSNYLFFTGIRGTADVATREAELLSMS